MEKNFCVNIVHSSVMGGFAALACVALARTVTPSIVAQAKLDTAKIEQSREPKESSTKKRASLKSALRARIFRLLQRE